jgi:hypothetical protein
VIADEAIETERQREAEVTAARDSLGAVRERPGRN